MDTTTSSLLSPSSSSSSSSSSSFRSSEIEHRAVDSLKPYARNARRHSAKQVRRIAESIREFGFTNPVLIDENGGVLAGHGRLQAAKLLGMPEVATLRLDHLTEAQKRAYIIADNRLAEKAGWDKGMLALELGELAELDFDLQLTGFETPEIDLLLMPVEDDEDEAPEPDLAQPAVSRLGDLWQLGPHRLYCGDSTLAASYEQALGGEQAQLVFTDPPYNVRIDGHVTVAGNTRHGEFVMASGEMSPAQFTSFLAAICQQLVAHTTDGSIHFICMDWRHMAELLAAGLPCYAELKNLCVWNKDNGGMGSLYRSKHELVFVFKNGTAAHVNNIELGKHGRNRTNVWNYAGASSLRKGRSQRLAMHPTVKPVEMIADAIQDCSHRDALVLDPFGGSGSTLLAAQRTGRRAALIEMDPRYVDVTIQRFDRLGQVQAVHAQTGLSWAELAEQRCAQAEAPQEAA